MFQRSIIGILLLLTILVYIIGCGNNKKNNKPGTGQALQTVPVTVIPVVKKTMNNFYFTTGSLESVESVELGSEIAGRITKLFSDEGKRVARGDVLVQLDDVTLQAQLAQAEAKLASAAADLEKIKAGARPQELATAEHSYLEAKSNFDLASTDFIRIKNMFEQGVASRQELDSAENQLRIKKSAFLRSEENLSLVREGARKEDRDAAKAIMDEELANVRYYKTQIAKTRIHVPFDGMVTRKYKEEGEMIKFSDDPIFRVERIQTLQAILKIPQEDAGQMKMGDIVSILAPDGNEYSGKITLISPAIDTDNRSVKLEVSIDNSSLELRPGMFVQANILVESRPDALTILKEALQSTVEAGKYNLAVIENNKAKIVSVKLGISEGEEMEILEGVKENDQIAVRGADRLIEGTPVKIVMNNHPLGAEQSLEQKTTESK